MGIFGATALVSFLIILKADSHGLVTVLDE